MTKELEGTATRLLKNQLGQNAKILQCKSSEYLEQVRRGDRYSGVGDGIQEETQ